MEETYFWGAVAVLASALVGWLLGRFKPAKSTDNGRRGDHSGIAGDLQQTADEAGAISDKLAEGADDSGKLAEDLGGAAGLLGDVIEGLQEEPGDPDRADDLLSELLKRHGKTDTKPHPKE